MSGSSFGRRAVFVVFLAALFGGGAYLALTSGRTGVGPIKSPPAPAPAKQPLPAPSRLPQQAPPPLRTDQAATLNVCNRSAGPISLVIMARLLTAPSEWLVHGWWNIDAGRCTVIGRYASGDIYYAAISPNGRRWKEGDISLCVAMQAFRRVHSPGYTCPRGQHLLFFKRVHAGTGSYTLNLQ